MVLTSSTGTSMTATHMHRAPYNPAVLLLVKAMVYMATAPTYERIEAPVSTVCTHRNSGSVGNRSGAAP